ncbi:MAG: glycerol-3-phosphate 1-O-acyltransferase PlsB [Steroidobacteraceae bacterium]|jgi:glycerol-3-phosphate O-acyltransferase|nr:glycerol-3-phosphate 1-O-acyltransferase PlsB [Steroidobacteraceae bacterium]
MRYLGLDRTALWIAARIASLWVRPTVLPLDEAERLRGRGRRVVYVLEQRSLADLVALKIACRRLGLPSPGRRFRVGGHAERMPVVALERTRGWLRSRVDRRLPERLSRIVTHGLVARDFAIDFVPVSVFWGRAPGRERSWFRLMFAEDWTLVGRTARLLSTFVNGRSTLVHFGDPAPLGEFTGQGLEARRSVRRVARRMRAEFRNVRAATIGPDLSHRRTIVAEVIGQRAVRAAVAGEMRDRNLSRREALGVATRYAYEIAADYSHRFVRFMDVLLTRLWTRLYDGVEVLNGERLSAAEGAQVVYVPCHRSHMDYLLLSYVIYHRGFVVPHIAAGVNLNLPVIGRFLRKGGAFFLRRTFKGNALYPAVFTSYLSLMMRRGHPIEYFIEGGRSRTGRLLPPKTGMLSMTLRAFLRDPSRPVVFVPVYFGYERLFEAKAYVGELSGRPKEKETVVGLLRALPQLRERFGRVYVSFGEPIDLQAHLDSHAPGWREQPRGDARPPWLGGAVDSLAATIQCRVNAAAAISPVALLALALLSTPRQAMPEADLVRQLELYRRLAELAPYARDTWCTPMSGAEIVEYGRALDLLESVPHPLGTVVRMGEECAILAAYYRNNVVHAYALPSLVACAFVSQPTMTREDIGRLAWRVYPYIARELFLRWREDEVPAAVDRVLESLSTLGLLRCESADGVERWHRPPTGTTEAVQLSVLANATLQVIERYYLAIALLLQAGPDAITQEALESRCQQMASRMSLLYELRSPEFFDRPLFRQFLDLLRHRSVIGTSPSGRLVYGQPLLDVARDARLVLSEQIRHSILQVTHA